MVSTVGEGDIDVESGFGFTTQTSHLVLPTQRIPDNLHVKSEMALRQLLSVESVACMIQLIALPEL